MCARKPLMMLLLLVIAIYSSALKASNDFVVVAHPQAGIEKMSKDEVINIYMGRNRKLPSGITAQPLDITSPLGEKANFYFVMVNKELSEISSYWARLLFSGQGSPPKQIGTAEQALEIVSTSKGAIAYIDRKKIDRRVKVIFDPANS